jgi:hypothetical protein
VGRNKWTVVSRQSSERSWRLTVGRKEGGKKVGSWQLAEIRKSWQLAVGSRQLAEIRISGQLAGGEPGRLKCEVGSSKFEN